MGKIYIPERVFMGWAIGGRHGGRSADALISFPQSSRQRPQMDWGGMGGHWHILGGMWGWCGVCRLLCTPGDPLALLRHTQSPRLSCCPLQPVLVPVQQSGTAAARESFVCGARSLLLVTACNSWKCGTAVRSPERN